MSGPSQKSCSEGPGAKLIAEIHEAWAVEHGYRKKATSNKPQAPSAKPQATSAKQQAKKYYRKIVGSRSMNQQA